MYEQKGFKAVGKVVLVEYYNYDISTNYGMSGVLYVPKDCGTAPFATKPKLARVVSVGPKVSPEINVGDWVVTRAEIMSGFHNDGTDVVCLTEEDIYAVASELPESVINGNALKREIDAEVASKGRKIR